MMIAIQLTPERDERDWPHMVRPFWVYDSLSYHNTMHDVRSLQVY